MLTHTSQSETSGLGFFWAYVTNMLSVASNFLCRIFMHGSTIYPKLLNYSHEWAELATTGYRTQMIRLSLRNNRLKFLTSGDLPQDHSRGIYGIYLNISWKAPKTWTCNWWDLESLGSWPINAQNSPQTQCHSNYVLMWHVGPLC